VSPSETPLPQRDRVDPPEVSVIMPVLNAAATLPRALASLAEQQAAYETIIVDGGSTDATPEIAAAAPAARVIAAPGSSIYQAINLGLAPARAAIVVLLNADDMLLPGALGAGIAALTAAPDAEIACGRASFVEEDPAGRLSPVPEIDRRAAGPMSLTLITTGPLSINRLFLRRRVFERIGLFDTTLRYAADRDWVLRAMLAGVPIAEIDAALYRYVVHPGSSTLDRQRRNYIAIRREHTTITERYLTDPAFGACPLPVRRAVRRWHAAETAMLCLSLLRQRALGDAVAAGGRAFATAPAWPLALVGAMAGRTGDRRSRPAPGDTR
jgi:glycosyltransferase involved in cell wall biosynthesis